MGIGMIIENNALGFYKISPSKGMKLVNVDKTMVYEDFIYAPTQDVAIEVTEEEAETIKKEIEKKIEEMYNKEA